MQRLFQFLLAFVTVLGSIRADSGSEPSPCDFFAVIDVANEYYPGCRDLYNVLQRSAPVNYTSRLCDDSECMAAINKIQAMNLGDCIIFGSTTLTSDLLDQCKEEAKSTAWIGWLMLALTLMLFIPVVIFWVRHYQRKKAEAQLDLANGKLGINDAPYKVIDLAGTHV
ncbi:hypothetical protein DVH05_007518 [Phytophthora capsici]|nr:hypothetical protein DVH05_007518 [Phytophthora capsici]